MPFKENLYMQIIEANYQQHTLYVLCSCDKIAQFYLTQRMDTVEKFACRHFIYVAMLTTWDIVLALSITWKVKPGYGKLPVRNANLLRLITVAVYGKSTTPVNVKFTNMN